MLKLGTRCLSLICCALACGLPLAMAAQETQRPTAPVTQEPSSQENLASVATLSPPVELPDSPGSLRAQSQDAPGTTSQTGATSAQQPAPPQDQTPQRPVGTAAAEAPKVSGITAAEPAGIAIAPGKQRRTRTIVIKVAAIVAAGAALGTVIALSEATSSKPPGAH